MNTHIKKITGVSSNTERAEATVVPFSPVFIGSGDKYYKGIDFFCHGGQTCLFDHQKIFKEFLNDLDNLEQALGKKDLATFLKARGKNLQNYVKLQWNGEVKGRDLAAPLTDGFGHPLLPGSSLKGSIRTALFADFFRRRKISAVQYEKLISRGKVGDKRLNSRLLTTWSGGQKKPAVKPTMIWAGRCVLGMPHSARLTQKYSIPSSPTKRTGVSDGRNPNSGLTKKNVAWKQQPEPL